jgi:hypothetical protein
MYKLGIKGTVGLPYPGCANDNTEADEHVMDREVGDRNFPLWLIGDSNPVQWQSFLKTPLDPRHPIRHNIWTAILDVVQERVFRQNRSRVNTSSLYIRNAVDNPAKKPSQTSKEWKQVTETEIEDLQQLIEAHRPTMVLCFGAFAFEFARRALSEPDRRQHGYWSARRLGGEFRHRMQEFEPGKINVLPLLHRSISGGKFLESHKYFCGQPGVNYFEMVGGNIADKMIQYREQLRIWIE